MGCRDHMVSVEDAGATEVKERSIAEIVLDWNHEGVVTSWGYGSVYDPGQFPPSQYRLFDRIIQRAKNWVRIQELDLVQKNWQVRKNGDGRCFHFENTLSVRPKPKIWISLNQRIKIYWTKKYFANQWSLICCIFVFTLPQFQLKFLLTARSYIFAWRTFPKSTLFLVEVKWVRSQFFKLWSFGSRHKTRY